MQKRADEGDDGRQRRKEARREAEEATDEAAAEEAPETSAQGEEDVEHADDWEGWIDLEDGSEEARLNRMSKPSNPPSAEMIRQRELSHCQYRSWCPVCVQAAANDRPHAARGEGPDDAPEVHSDYAFFRNKRGDKTHMPVLITKNRKMKSVSAHGVPKKGTRGGWIVQQYLRDRRKQGLRSKLILRSDGEPAIRSLLDRVADLRRGETILENSPVGDSQANGLAERAVQSVQKQTRILKLATERAYKYKIGVEHPCFPWMVEHAADLLDKFVVGKDGRTEYERTKSRKYGGLMFPFGTKVLYRVPDKPQGGVHGTPMISGHLAGKAIQLR